MAESAAYLLPVGLIGIKMFFRCGINWQGENSCHTTTTLPISQVGTCMVFSRWLTPLFPPMWLAVLAFTD